MEKKQCIVITLPESLAELPIRIERDADCQGIVDSPDVVRFPAGQRRD